MASSSFSSHLWLLSAIKAQISDRYLEDKVLFAHLGLHRLCESCSMNMYIIVCHVAEVESGGMGNCCCVKPKFIIQAFLWKVFNRLKSFKIVHQLDSQGNCCLGQEDRFLMFPTPPSSQNPPSSLITFMLNSCSCWILNCVFIESLILADVSSLPWIPSYTTSLLFFKTLQPQNCYVNRIFWRLDYKKGT